MVTEQEKDKDKARNKCMQLAKYNGFKVFAMTEGGVCLSNQLAHRIYDKNGKADGCVDGMGGEGKMNAYIIKHGKYS